MIVSFFDSRIDAAHVNLCRHRGILRMLAVDVDLTIELGEFSVRSPQKLMHTETDPRARRIEPVYLVRQCGGTQADDCDYSDKIRQFHFEFSFVLFSPPSPVFSRAAYGRAAIGRTNFPKQKPDPLSVFSRRALRQSAPAPSRNAKPHGPSDRLYRGNRKPGARA